MSKFRVSNKALNEIRKEKATLKGCFRLSTTKLSDSYFNVKIIKGDKNDGNKKSN